MSGEPRDPVAGASREERTKFLEEADTDLKNSEGQKLVGRLSSHRRTFESWNGFSSRFVELLEHCETNAEASAELAARSYGDRSHQQALILALDQSILAYTAGLTAVVEQARDISRKYLSVEHRDEAVDRNQRMKEDHPYALFFAKMRNYVLHYLAAPWSFAADLEAGTGSVNLDTPELLRSDMWGSEVKSWLQSAEPKIAISEHISPHLSAMAEYGAWLHRTAWSDQAEAIEEMNALVERRNLILTMGRSDGRDMGARIADIELQLKRRRQQDDD